MLFIGTTILRVSHRALHHAADVVTYDQAPEKETDPHRLAQRQKQIDYGKNTLGYQNYIAAVPKAKRDKFTHPSTPDINNPVGKRQWDGLVSISPSVSRCQLVCAHGSGSCK